ncbi:MAG: YdcF family protein [Rhodanobacter sp.]
MRETWHSCWRWIAGIALTFTVLTTVAISQAGRYLEAPVSAPSKADVLVALGGETGDRTLTAASLFREGFASRLLITGLDTSPTEVRPAYLHWRAQVLAEKGVPLDRIIGDAKSSNSWEEAVNTRRTMEANGWRRVLVVSDPYHVRRLSLAWERAFRGSGLSYSLAASSPKWWNADAWWHDENSALVVINEYIKLVYYVSKY